VGGEVTAMTHWDPYPEYRPFWQICVGDQTCDSGQYGWSTVASSVPCDEHPDCHILSYLGDRAGTHRAPSVTILSRLPLTRTPAR
jgi:hypothetical protein